jgi:hypothetical protein
MKKESPEYIRGYIEGLRDARDAFQKEYRKPEDIINGLIIVKHYLTPIEEPKC